MIHRTYTILSDTCQIPMALAIPDVNTYNWPDKIGEVLAILYNMDRLASSFYGGIKDRIGLEAVIQGGEDAPLVGVEQIQTKVNELIETYVPKSEVDMYKEQYQQLLKELGTSSNIKLANRTFDFCVQFLPME